jgi:hypothetical protein
MLDGEVLGSGDPRVAEAIEIASKARLHGETDASRDTVITRYGEYVSMELTTNKVDVAGRSAPLLVTLPFADLEPASIPSVVDTVAAHAALLDRSFDAAALREDIVAWRQSREAGGDQLSTLYCRLRDLVRELFYHSKAGVKKALGYCRLDRKGSST